MARAVKCKICKAKGDSDTFYRVTDDKGRNSYYCSKEEYEQREKEKEDRYMLLKYVAEEVLEYDNGQIVPPSMVKRIEKLSKFYGFNVIKETFYLNKETIQYWIRTKDFSNEYGMCSYVMAIIESNINDAYKKWKREQEQKAKMKSKTIDTMIFDDLVMTEPIKQSNSKDISMFLDEEDL